MKIEAAEKAKNYSLANKGQGKYKFAVVNGNNS
jgi:hypothetical protein